MEKFTAQLQIIGVNPYVSIPDDLLKKIFVQAGKDKGPIPIYGEVNGKPYQQTLMKFAGEWRLYVNLKMFPNSPKRIGEWLELTVGYDSRSRSIEPQQKWVEAIAADTAALEVFQSLSPSRQHEIVRYLASLKSQESVIRNIERALDFLKGNARFVGRDRPR